MNTPPQVDGLIEGLSGQLAGDIGNSGPSWRSGTANKYSIEDSSGRVSRPLHRRLSPEQRAALVTAFTSGVRQRDLATQYGISIRSVKRLVRAARDVGAIAPPTNVPTLRHDQQPAR